MGSKFLLNELEFRLQSETRTFAFSPYSKGKIALGGASRARFKLFQIFKDVSTWGKGWHSIRSRNYGVLVEIAVEEDLEIGALGVYRRVRSAYYFPSNRTFAKRNKYRK